MKGPGRRLNVGGLLEGVPTWGTCDKCGAFFSVVAHCRTTAELAREKLLSNFDAHQCKSAAKAGNSEEGGGATVTEKKS